MTAVSLFGSPAGFASIVADTATYTMGVQFACSLALPLDGIKFYSASGAGALPDTIALFAVSGQALLHFELASWSGAAGSGWVTALFAVPPALTPATAYKGCVLNSTGGTNWYSDIPHYWDTGTGAGGISSPPLSAPNNAGGDGGQCTFNFGTGLVYPASSFNATNYGVDVQVTVSGSSPRGLLNYGVT